MRLTSSVYILQVPNIAHGRLHHTWGYKLYSGSKVSPQLHVQFGHDVS